MAIENVTAFYKNRSSIGFVPRHPFAYAAVITLKSRDMNYAILVRPLVCQNLKHEVRNSSIWKENGNCQYKGTDIKL